MLWVVEFSVAMSAAAKSSVLMSSMARSLVAMSAMAKSSVLISSMVQFSVARSAVAKSSPPKYVVLLYLPALSLAIAAVLVPTRALCWQEARKEESSFCPSVFISATNVPLFFATRHRACVVPIVS